MKLLIAELSLTLNDTAVHHNEVAGLIVRTGTFPEMHLESSKLEVL